MLQCPGYTIVQLYRQWSSCAARVPSIQCAFCPEEKSFRSMHDILCGGHVAPIIATAYDPTCPNIGIISRLIYPDYCLGGKHSISSPVIAIGAIGFLKIDANPWIIGSFQY